MKKYIIVLLLTFFVVGCSSHVQDCEGVKRKVENKNITNYLTSWAKKNIRPKNINLERVLSGGGRPGRYWYAVEFDWDRIGFKPDSQVRLVGRTYADFDKTIRRLDYVFFGEKSGYGILIELSKRKSGFAIDSNSIIPISKGVAIYCQERD